MGAPTLAREVALSTFKVLSQICIGDKDVQIDRGNTGIYHLTAGGETNWHAFAETILKEAGGCAVPPAWIWLPQLKTNRWSRAASYRLRRPSTQPRRAGRPIPS